MPEEQAQAQASDRPVQAGKKKQTFMMLGILAGVMLLEGGGIYFAVKFLGGPQRAAAEGLAEVEGKEGEGGHQAVTESARDVELPVAKIRSPNMKSGRLFLYDIEVFARTGKDKAAGLQKTLEANKATIEDRLNRLIRAAEPQDLQEDGLETLRRQLKRELGQLAGDEKMIEEILIPKCTPFRVDF